TIADETESVPVTQQDIDYIKNTHTAIKNWDVPKVFDQEDPHQYLIFIADDGTKNDGNARSDDIDTNVYDLTSLVERGEHVRTIYIKGVGTSFDPALISSATGLGVIQQVDESYNKVGE